MAYNKRFLLNKVAKIQSIVAEQKKKGVSQKWTYDNLIKDAFHISYPTFNNYLAIYVKGELEKIENKEREKKRQMSLEFE